MANAVDITLKKILKIARALSAVRTLAYLIGGILISIALGVKGDSKHKENRVHGIVLSSIFLAFLIYLAFFMK